jgi:hypothetical protein
MGITAFSGQGVLNGGINDTCIGHTQTEKQILNRVKVISERFAYDLEVNGRIKDLKDEEIKSQISLVRRLLNILRATKWN